MIKNTNVNEQQLGGISAQQPKKKSVIGLFRRESSVSGGAGAAVTDSDSSIHLSGTTPARSHSTKRTSLVGGIPVEPLDIGGHSGKHDYKFEFKDV